MNPIDRNKIWKMVGILALITVVAGGLLRVSQHNSYTLGDYAADNPSLAYQTAEPSPSLSPSPTPAVDNSPADTTEILQEESSMAETAVLTGISLNGELMADQRTTLSEGFYYEPLSEKLQRYITGVSYPATVDNSGEASEDLLKSVEIGYDDLRYMHIRHYDFEGNPAEGELICNKAIAQDLIEIFYELYCNEYQLEKVLLIDEYGGDDLASMEDNNTSCFNYRPVDGTSSLSKHALGLAIDINPFYNPYVGYNKDGSERVSPESAAVYADRSASFPYKIDENDLCYQLFKEHGFTWGGHWNSCKDYQHFQKVVE